MRRPASGRESIFTVDHFIMRQRQDEVFSVVVEHPEGQFIVMILTINRVELHVVRGVMHPSRVPLVPEAQTAHVLRTRNAVEIGRPPPLSPHRKPAHQEYGWYYARIQSLQDSRARQIRSGSTPLFTAVVAINH